MTETKVQLCGVCQKNEATIKCEVCGMPLCPRDTKKVRVDELSLAAVVKPGITLSPLRQGIKVWKVCAKCMTEKEFYEGEYV